MGTKLKTLVIDKMFPQFREQKKILNAYNNIYVTYKHAENLFHVQMSTKEIYHDRINLPKPDSSATYHGNNETLRVNIKRETFIEHVLSKGPAEVLSESKPKKIVMDFSSPNIAKPFHAGHLRSTIIGNFIANITKYFGNKVTRINYLGDWGTQFGILQYGLQAKNIDLNQLRSDPIKNLYEIYVYANKLSSTDNNVQIQARKYFSDIEQGKTSLDDWKKIRDITIQELEKVYQRLGISFDCYHWESDYNGRAIKDMLFYLEKKNIIQTDVTGKKIVKYRDRNVTLMKSDNSTLYLSRDIAALLDRYEKYKFDKMLYIVDNAQADHFASLFDIMKRINVNCANACEHIKFGRIKGMSTRAGNVVFLNDILDEAKRKMVEKQKQSKNTRNAATNKQTCDTLGITAVLINDLKQKRLKDYTFEWDKALQTEGDSGIKLQYLHCRLWSLEQSCGVSLPDVCDPQYLTEDIIGEIVAELARFENILYRAYIESEACIIVNYLFRIAKLVNRMFNELKVKNVDSDLAAQRLLVYHSARVVVKTSLEILGVKPLLEM